MVSFSSSSLAVNGGFFLTKPNSSFSNRHPSPPLFFKWGSRRDQGAGRVTHRAKGQAVQVLANPNVSSGKGNSKKVVVMVDPLEAKRLAAKQMEGIKAKENFKRKRQAEAVNGAWAMIGLTAGLIIEGQTGNGIVAQLAGYWAALTSLLGRFSQF
ncbi:hypothetical protein LguiB_024315 [Lonicera macranthoides]